MTKKIGLIGNSGNCSYWYAKHLRESGVDARLYIIFKKYDKNGNPILCFDEDPRTEDVELAGDLPDWIKLFYIYSIKNCLKALKEFEQHDLNIAFGSTAIFFQFTKKPLIFFATGTDLREQVFKRTIKNFLMKKGILRSKMILFDNIDMMTIRAIRKIGVKKYQWIPCYLPSPDLSKKGLIKDNFFSGFKEKYAFFCFSRLDFGKKGSDILIRGFAAFAKKHRGLARLFLIDYGKDAKKAKALTRELGVKEDVSFLRFLSSADVIRLLKQCSLAFGYFKSVFSGIYHYPFSIMDSLKSGAIIISSIDEEAFKHIVGEEPPVLKAYTEKDIESQINFVLENYEKIKGDFSKSGPLWTDKYHSKEFINQRLMEAINQFT